MLKLDHVVRLGNVIILDSTSSIMCYLPIFFLVFWVDLRDL